jgi:ankyrin repeat protein
MVQTLLLYGADKNAIDQDGATPLISACRKRSKQSVIETLLAHQADPEVIDCDGWTALTRASCCGYLEIVKLLVDHGANVEQPTAYGLTALMGAIEYGQVEVVNYLLDHNAYMPIDWIDASLLDLCQEVSGNLELNIDHVERLVCTLLDHGVSVDEGITIHITVILQQQQRQPQQERTPEKQNMEEEEEIGSDDVSESCDSRAGEIDDSMVEMVTEVNSSPTSCVEDIYGRGGVIVTPMKPIYSIEGSSPSCEQKEGTDDEGSVLMREEKVQRLLLEYQ